MNYNTDLFNADTIIQLISHFQILLEGIVANPDQRISNLPILTETARQQLLVDWNDTKRDYPKDSCIHELFEAQVKRTPEAIALQFEGQQLTYRELNNRANQVAHYLRSLGVGPEELVGLCVERSLEMVVALLGILKAGGAYVPLDPDYPKERLAFMLEDAHVSVLLTQKSLLQSDQLSALGSQTFPFQLEIVCLDGNWKSIAQQSEDDPQHNVNSCTAAYVIYTSGSTGTPKGVIGLHRGAVNRFAWMWSTYPFLANEMSCVKTLLSFVDSVWEVFGPLLKGIPSIIVSDQMVKDPQLLIQTLANNHVTRIVLVPSLLKVILDVYPNLQTHLPDLKLWCSSGEPLSKELAERFRKFLPNSTLLNLYGSSEVSADATYHEMCDTESSQCISIGRPINNTQIYLLDSHLQPAPVEVRGEIYIGGVGLARGYLNRPELTAEKFIPNPFSAEPGARLYKTGDLARYLPDGNIEFLGRVDNQVKIRGFRIELGEVESVLGQHPGVRETVVVAQQEVHGGKQLVAYVAPKLEPAPTTHELQRFLQEKLPHYMIPSAFVYLESLPLTPNGKVDRRALPNPRSQDTRGHNEYVGPRDETERVLARVWSAVLGIDRVGLDDDFFAIGGHSLLAAKLFARLDEAFGRSLPLGVLFAAPTIRALAERYRNTQKSKARSAIVALRTNGAFLPIFAVPGVFGNVVCFADLAHELDSEQSFYGLQSVGLDGADGPLDSIEEMARLYVSEVRSVQPHGPYVLIGACFGATVAYEMARQLLDAGEEVALLGLLDPTRREGHKASENPSSVPKVFKHAMALGSFITHRLRLYRKEMRGLDIGDRIKFVTHKIRSLSFKIGYKRTFGSVRREIYQLQVIRANVRALVRYYRNPLNGRLRTIEIFETSHPRNTTAWSFDWKTLWDGHPVRHRVPGKDSGDMLSGENARVLAALLAKRLRAAFGEKSGQDLIAQGPKSAQSADQT